MIKPEPFPNGRGETLHLRHGAYWDIWYPDPEAGRNYYRAVYFPSASEPATKTGTGADKHEAIANARPI